MDKVDVDKEEVSLRCQFAVIDLTPPHTDTQRSYLIFVIFFTQAKFLENRIYTEKCVNYDKLHSKLPILHVNYDKLNSKLPIFCVKSVKIYTSQKKFTRPPPLGARDKYEV